MLFFSYGYSIQSLQMLCPSPSPKHMVQILSKCSQIIEVEQKSLVDVLKESSKGSILIKIGNIWTCLQGKLTPWPTSVDSTSSLKMVGQHLLLKAVSQAVVVPFLSTSLIETVQSDIASEKPGIFDFLKEGILRLGPQSGSRTLPMWQLIPSSVIHSMMHYIISTIVRAVSGKIMKSRHRALQEQQGAISKPKGVPPGLSQYREQISGVIGLLFADIILYPVETVLHRLHLQGTRTIIDNLETGREVVPIITRYEGFADCFTSIVSDEGISGLFKGFGSLVMQYAFHFLLLRMTFASMREGLRLVANPNDDFPAEYLEKAKQQPLPAQVKQSPEQIVQQQSYSKDLEYTSRGQQQRKKQDFVFYE